MRCTAIVLAVAALAVCVAAPAVDAGGRIALYADANREGCELVDVYPGVVQIHMFYEGDLGARSVLFAAPTPECWDGAVWLGDVFNEAWLPGLGDTHDLGNGTLINLLGCRSGPLYLGYMSFQHQGRAEPCCAYEIVGSENEGDPAVIDCTDTIVAVDTGELVVNPGSKCACVGGSIIVSAQETTWGHVKSLYR